MLVAAAAGIGVAAAQAAAAKRVALLVRDGRANGIPDDVAAGLVERADRVAAVEVVAVGVVVGHAAVACVGCAADRVRARIRAGRILVRARSAELVPLDIAAEDVEVADRLAAGRVVAPRRLARLAAVARAGRSAAELVALAACGRVDLLDAGLVPLGGAAELVDRADGVAAVAIRAPWARVREVAAGRADVAALGGRARAELACLLGTRLGPGRDAAALELLEGADGRAAGRIAAAARVVGVVAVARDGQAASALAGGARREDARGIPAHIAAVGLEAADGFTA